MKQLFIYHVPLFFNSLFFKQKRLFLLKKLIGIKIALVLA